MSQPIGDSNTLQQFLTAGDPRQALALVEENPDELLSDQALAAELQAMLQAELDIYRRNLAGLRLQVAKHGGPDYAPTALRNEMRDTEMAIERVEQELVQLEEC